MKKTSLLLAITTTFLSIAPLSTTFASDPATEPEPATEQEEELEIVDDEETDVKKPMTLAEEVMLVTKAFCEDMSKEEVYDEKRLGNYKTMIQGKDGWVFRTNVSFKQDYTINEQTQRYLKELQDGFKRHGTDFVVLIPPARGLIHHTLITNSDKEKHEFTKGAPQAAWQQYKNTLATLNNAGINAVQFPDIDKGIPFFYKRDHHWSPDGAKISAQQTAERIKALPVYAELEKTAFTTTKDKIKGYKGSFTKAFQKICKTNLPPEATPKYVTERTNTASDSNALFDDNTSTAPVILLGTSNSSPKPNVANYDGFLKEALSVDVENLALAGAGVDTSMIAYINSEEFKTNPAKVAIWEVPGYYNINRMNSQVFLQAIPALHGDCEDDAIVETAVKNAEKGTDLFEDITDKNIMGEDYYLSLKFEKQPKRPFSVKLLYETYSDTHRFSRSKRYPTPDGQYYLSFRFDNKGPLEHVVLALHDKTIGANVEARICKKKNQIPSTSIQSGDISTDTP